MEAYALKLTSSQYLILYHMVCCLMTILSPISGVENAVNLRGAGASFPYAVYEEWITNFERQRRGIRLNMKYESVGSGTGKKRIQGIGDPVEYAGSDLELDSSDYVAFPDLQMFPTMAGAVVVAYHLPGIPNLHLKREHLVRIYNGTIQWWNDTDIVGVNPDVILPEKRIIVLARSDKSGTTEIFTRTLSSFSPEWNATYGTFSLGLVDYKPVRWNPDVLSYYGKTNSGMAGLLLSMRYSLGYLSTADAEKSRLKKANIFNKEGVLVEANVTTIQSAMNAFADAFSPKMTLSIADAPGALSYPIASFTYLIIFKTTMKDCRSATALYRYIEWFLLDELAKKTTISNNMVPISEAVVEKISSRVLDNMYCKGRLLKLAVAEEKYNEFIASQTWRTPLYIAVPIVLSFLILFLTYIIVQQIKLNKAILKNEYIIPSNTIDILKSIGSFGSLLSSRTRSAKSMADKLSLPHREALSHGQSVLYGRWNQEVVIMKPVISVTGVRELKHVTKRSLLSMRDYINHMNVVHFFGITEIDRKLQLVSSFCPKGTLQNVIHTERFNLDTNFKYTMALDIAMGMNYLHQNNIVHGFLSTETCFIDSRWNIKVGDWQHIKILNSQNLINDNGSIRKIFHDAFGYTDDNMEANHLFWTAPEVLSNRNGPPTKYSDVYSFCISVVELFTRSHPFDDALVVKEPKEIIKDIYKADYRPNLSEEIPNQLAPILTMCWATVPTDRPNFTKVARMIKSANPNRKSVLDCMMEELENYVEHLEEKVNERTVELDAALKQVEGLLHKILPPSVADALSRGESVKPETFESVTIYFSDIVNFTSLASESSPLEIVDLLNDLYTTFDEIIDQHDVYKVETIGDAYMCISGLPKRNNITHASHIANLSMDIAVACGSFHIRHRPKENLRLRIGVNSGSVVAGVVGNKMPRYCLFGDAVNTASRMESNSRPMKIHLSQSTKELLDAIGGYKVRKRGPRSIKGKGSMVTYWLVGKIGYDKELPRQTVNPEHDDDLSEGLDGDDTQTTVEI